MSNPNLSLRDQIVSWLRMNDQTIASFERICGNVVGASTYEQLNALVYANPDTFRLAKIRGGKAGLKLLPYAPATAAVPAEVALQSNEITTEVPPVQVGDVVSIGDEVAVVALVPVVKTPNENVESLIEQSANAENSSASENYAHAAFLAAQAIATLKHAATM